jgi:hypothetical protein
MQRLKAVGLILAILVALMLLYQASQNGRYYPMPHGDGQLFVIMDTRTGAWNLDMFLAKEVHDLRRRKSQ